MFDDSPLEESFRYFVKRMVEEDQTQGGHEWTTVQLNTGFWQPRVTGTIVFISALFMILMAWKRRNLLFHRLVLGMSLNQLVFSIFLMYGAAAIPSDDINAIGNFGTVSTCTTQGFFIYVCGNWAMFYYASFSVYSFVGVLFNFKKEEYLWVEKYIHTIVPIYPLITAFVILSKQGFNKSDDGVCRATNAPLGCDDPNHGDVPCERGQLSNQGLYFYIVYHIIALFLPTAVMVFLYVKVKQQQSQIFIDAKVVAQQAAIYLFALYLVILPWFVVDVMMIVSGHRDNIPFAAIIFVNVNFDLFGLFMMLTYAYFTFDRFGSNRNSNRNKNGNDNATGNDNSNDNGNDNGKVNVTEEDIIATTNTTTTNNNEVGLYNNEFIFGLKEVTPKSNTAPTTMASPTPTLVPAPQPKYSFNIFDGTNAASGAFAAFVHDGDSDDERVDHEQTMRWDAIQDHV